MSVFNDIALDKKKHEETCVSNIEKLKMYAKRFSQGHWMTLKK